MTAWIATINTGIHLSKYENEQATTRETALALADELDRFQQPHLDLLGALDELREIAEDMRLVTDDVEELDDYLSRMYDWGDYWKVWFNPVFSIKEGQS